MRLGTVRLKPPVVGGLSAGMCVALPFSSLYSPQVSRQDCNILPISLEIVTFNNVSGDFARGGENEGKQFPLQFGAQK
jgi:hypothetical protein